MDELISKLRSQVAETQSQASQGDVSILKDTEISTSQPEYHQKNRFKLDFDILRKYRAEECMRVCDLKESDSFKIDGPVWVIIKSIECFQDAGGCVYRWEMIDETGVIFGSTNVSDPSIMVGSVVCLSKFSIWKISGNHLNIVARNLKEVIN